MTNLQDAILALNALGALAAAFAAGGLWVRVGKIERWIERREQALTEVQVHLGEVATKVDGLSDRIERLAEKYWNAVEHGGE